MSPAGFSAGDLTKNLTKSVRYPTKNVRYPTKSVRYLTKSVRYLTKNVKFLPVNLAGNLPSESGLQFSNLGPLRVIDARDGAHRFTEAYGCQLYTTRRQTYNDTLFSCTHGNRRLFTSHVMMMQQFFVCPDIFCFLLLPVESANDPGMSHVLHLCHISCDIAG